MTTIKKPTTSRSSLYERCTVRIVDPDRPGVLVDAEILEPHPRRKGYLLALLPSNNGYYPNVQRGVCLDKEKYADAFVAYQAFVKGTRNRRRIHRVEDWELKSWECKKSGDLEISAVFPLPWGETIQTDVWCAPRNKGMEFQLCSKAALSLGMTRKKVEDMIKRHERMSGAEQITRKRQRYGRKSHTSRGRILSSR